MRAATAGDRSLWVGRRTVGYQPLTAQADRPVDQLLIAGSVGREGARFDPTAELIQRDGDMAVFVGVDTNHDVVTLWALTGVVRPPGQTTGCCTGEADDRSTAKTPRTSGSVVTKGQAAFRHPTFSPFERVADCADREADAFEATIAAVLSQRHPQRRRDRRPHDAA